MSKLQGATLLFAAVLLPTGAWAQERGDHDRDRDRDHHERYYDSDRKDYHEWNEAEERAWRRYWAELNRPFIDWTRANDEQRRAYWRWRHEHPDHPENDRR
jgi:hypothetical protein